MERGIYFDGWYRNNHCYHPSMPFRSMQMIDDLEEFRGTVLVWSALGGGSISLPFLEHEAYGEVDPRLRFYGFMNDSEYIAECGRRGIKVFGIVFEAQGWELPAVYAQDGRSFRKLNVVDPADSTEWYGLREFSQDKRAETFGKRFRDYFPEGLPDIDGNPITDLWEACCTRDLEGNPCHTGWVEMNGHAHLCYLMCRNNPAWRQYLKKIIEIQIDAGVAGIQLDEPETPIPSIDYGGCFCRTCMRQFRGYLQTRASRQALPPELEGIDLKSFHYGEYLKSRGVEYPGKRSNIPLFREYWDFLLLSFKNGFRELTDHARQYARSRGREILVSGNFFNLLPPCYPNEPEVDLVITEMKQTLFRQPYWYRYAAGFAGEKPIVVVENPYGGIVSRLVSMLNQGRGFDLYKIFLLEAAVYGCNMAVPYGAWMGNVIKDSFHPPRDATRQVQAFLSEREDLFSTRSGSNLLVLYSFPSYCWREATEGYDQYRLAWNREEDLLSYNVADMIDPEGPRLPFWEVAKQLSDLPVPFDVGFLADGELREDTFGIDDLRGYDLVILPDCHVLTHRQTETLSTYADGGGRILVFGRAAENNDGWLQRMTGKPTISHCPDDASKTGALRSFAKAFEQAHAGIWQIRADDRRLGFQPHLTREGLAIHLLNYRYSRQNDRILPIEKCTLKVHKSEFPGMESWRSVEVQTLDGGPVDSALKHSGDVATLRLRNLPFYAVVSIRAERG